MRRWIGSVWLLSVLVCPAVLAQNDLMLSGSLLEEESATMATQPVPPAGISTSVQSPAMPGRALRVVLLLPKKSGVFGAAAKAVQSGFEMAAERDRDERLKLSLVETGDAAAEVVQAYQVAEAEADIIVGPLTRSGVTAIALRARIEKPTLALAQAEPQGDREVRLPARLLAIGLSAEDEARQIARQMVQEGRTGRAYILRAQSAWQRRAALAFEQQWRQLRQVSESMEISADGAWLDQGGLQQFKRRLEREQPVLIFAALDADQASQVREATGGEVPMVGTSLLNPVPGQDWPAANRRPELNGVRLIDLPWLLQPDHPAVMAYRTGSASGIAGALPGGQPRAIRNAELERMVALGIDAWRIVREIASDKTAFEIDGVSGKLRIDMAAPQARFQRLETPAVYEDGVVVPAPY